MKTLTLELTDDVYERAERRATDRGSSLQEAAVQWLESYVNGTNDVEEQALSTTRARMRELFQTVKGFRMTTKLSREELHERGGLR